MWLACKFNEGFEELIRLGQLLQALIVESQSDEGWQDALNFEKSARYLFELIEHRQDDFFLQV